MTEDLSTYPLQPWEYIVAGVDSPFWKILEKEFKEELSRRLNVLLDTDGDVEARVKGEIKMLKWVIERPYLLIEEARDSVNRNQAAQIAEADTSHYVEHGRQSPIPPPSATQLIARPEIT